MKEYDHDFIDRLRAECDMVAVISDYVPLQKKGRNYWGCCPFHQEKTPSFSVAAEKGFFYCFGCQAGGDIFHFLMKVEQISFIDAVKLLAQRMNISLPERQQSEYDKQRARELAILYRVNELAGNFFHACLTKTAHGKQALEYLSNRGIDETVIREFQLGYAPHQWDKLSHALRQRGVQEGQLLQAGLAVSRSQGGVYDRFRHRIMFPIRDVRGRIVAFGGRVLDQSQPKYLNSPDTILFNKRNVLYGFHNSYKYIKETGQAIVLEGYLDLITAYSAGVKNVVASLGTAFTQEQAKQLLKLGQEIVFAYDSDAAGQNATLRALAIVRRLGAKIRVVSLPDGKDPDEYIRKHGVDEFREQVANASLLLDYQMKRVLESVDTASLEGKIAAVSQIVPVLADLDNAVEINGYISRLSEILAIDETAIRSELAKYLRLSKKDKKVIPGQTSSVHLVSSPVNDAASTAEKQLIRLMLDEPGLIPQIQPRLLPEDFQHPHRWELIRLLLDTYNKGEKDLPTALAPLLSEQAYIELSGIMVTESKVDDPLRMADDCLRFLRLSRLKDLYEKHRLQAIEFERIGDSRSLQELAESQRIKDEISKLYQ